MTDEEILEVLVRASRAVAATLVTTDGGAGAVAGTGSEPPGPMTGAREGQYHLDVAADTAAVGVLTGAGLGVVSEESGVHGGDRPVRVVLDPVDGSTNASRGLPWFATSLCAMDSGGPRVALVVNQASGTTFAAIRGGGATVDGGPLTPSTAAQLEGCVVGVTGVPATRAGGWWQFRAMGAVALDLCAVAAGSLDAYVDFTTTGHAPWDYMGALLVCREAGVAIVDRDDRDLVAEGVDERRHVIAAGTLELLAALRENCLLPGWARRGKGR